MRFHSKPIEEHPEVPLGDEGRGEELVAQWRERDRQERGAAEGGNACYVLSIYRPDDALVAPAQLAEIRGLVEAQGDRVVGAHAQKLVRPDARTLIRAGVAQRVGDEARELGADMLVIDAELTPSQTRNLEDATGLPVCDREAVILNVFERQATSRRARVQVEIAHLEYLRPRIRGIGLNMDQQAGGLMGSRGPGETASELLARRLDGRLAQLRRKLAEFERSDSTHRAGREGCARIALVGYTNAGKTSLMNALTAAGLSVRDRPFETLDTTSRSLTRHGGDVLLSDTVGFIRRLPERLFASFESTLAEVSEATLIVLVLDVSDPEIERHIGTTQGVLEKLGAASIPRLVVFNKLDRLEAPPDAAELERLSGGDPHVALSTHDGDAVESLRERLLAAARGEHLQQEIFVPYAEHGLIRSIYGRCRVLEAEAEATGTRFRLEGAPHIIEEIAAAAEGRR